MKFPESAVCRTAALKFAGHQMQFKLSHALFSSRKIDDGTMLLLKTLAQQNVVPETGRVVDVGCGVGPLAIALKKKYPNLTVVAQDRFALAVEFTKENARLNGVDVDVRCDLLLDGLDGFWDTIVSNVPAKAGEPVLEDFFARSLDFLSESGTAAVVIVSTLASWAERTLASIGAEVTFTEATREYSVFHYRKTLLAAPARSKDQDVYLRSQATWAMTAKTLSISTFWGLPNFNSLDYQLQVALSLVDKTKWKTNCLVVEPGQGHVPVTLAQLYGVQAHLVSCDVLALHASEVNLRRLGFAAASKHLISHWGDLEDLASARFDAAVVSLQTTAEIPWVEALQTALRRVLLPGATVLVSGSSTDLARFTERRKNFVVQRDLKYRGYRAVCFEFRPSSEGEER